MSTTLNPTSSVLPQLEPDVTLTEMAKCGNDLKIKARHAIVEADMRQITAADLPWGQLEGSTILVTGANGFVPAYLVEVLLYLNEVRFSRPVKVLALVRNHAKAVIRFAAFEGRNDFELLVQDVCEPIKYDKPIGYIIHAASQASPKFYTSDPAGTILPNVLGTFHLLELARRVGTKAFLFVSSGEVYGQFSVLPQSPLTEEDFGSSDPLLLRSCYGEGKRAGEAMCKAWQHQHGVPSVIVRLAHTYGPGMDLNDGRVFADFVGNIVRGEDIILKSDGQASRPFCYLADAVIGLFMVLLKGVPGTAYNVANVDAEIRIADLADLLCGLFPEKGLKAVRAQETTGLPLWNQKVILDTSRVRDLGWNPTTSPAAGFAKTVEFYQSFAAEPTPQDKTLSS